MTIEETIDHLAHDWMKDKHGQRERRPAPCYY
jgi:hypothetical protein